MFNLTKLTAAFITVPISVALPAMKGRGARSQTDYNVTKVPYSYDDPLFASQLQKIDMYMDYLEVGFHLYKSIVQHLNEFLYVCGRFRMICADRNSSAKSHHLPKLILLSMASLKNN